MDAAAMKHMASNFAKLEKFEGVDFRRWQKKMHFLLSSMSVVYMLTTHIPKDGSDDAAHTLKHVNEELTLHELGSHLHIEESLKMQDNDKPKGNNVAGPSVVNMVEHNNSSIYNDNKRKRKHHDNTRADPNKESKLTCWKCRKLGHLKKRLQRGCRAVVRLPDPKLKTLGERGIKCIFVGYAEHSKAFRALTQKSKIDYLDTYALVTRISTIRLLIAMTSIHNPIIHQMDVKIAFLDEEVDQTREFLSSRFSMKDMGRLILSLALGLNMKVLKSLKKTKDYRLTYTGYPSMLEGYTYASWISNIKDNSSTSGWVFLLAAGKEAEWLRNLILEIPLWSKPISPIFIRSDSAAALAKAYSRMYNGKSRHLGVRHSMIRELVINRVISIEFVISQ
nr:zinc finger, CCHC-type [Tanacetum cinerariifolium]